MAVPCSPHQHESRSPIEKVFTCCQTSDNSCATDARVYDRDDISKLALESGVEVSAALDCGQAVRVGEFSEYTDVAAVFELET